MKLENDRYFFRCTALAAVKRVRWASAFEQSEWPNGSLAVDCAVCDPRNPRDLHEAVTGHLPPFVRAVGRSFGRRLGPGQRTLTACTCPNGRAAKWAPAGRLRVLPAAGESSQDSSRLCSAEQGWRENCLLQADPSGRVGFLSIGLLIACTRSQHAASSSTPSFGARVQIPQCAIRPSLLSSPPFPNLIGEARVDENRRTVMHSIGGPKCFSIELRQLWFSSTRKSMS